MKRYSPKEFTNKLLQGSAIAIAVALMPNAVFGAIFGALVDKGDFFVQMKNILVAIQYTCAPLAGAMAAYHFGFNPLQMTIVGGASFIGSGMATLTDNGWVINGIGDLTNTILTAAIAILFVQFFAPKVKSLAIVFLPFLGGAIPAYIGLVLLPYVSTVALGIGNIINSFTQLQPLLMSILIAISFCWLIVTPISTVAIALAIQIMGLAAGAGNIGIAATAWTLFISSLYVNPFGVSLAFLLGGMKAILPNFIKHPIMMLPMALNAILAGVMAYLFNLQSTPESAGFGMSGLVGPITAFGFMDGSPMTRIITLIGIYGVVLSLGAFVINYLMTKVFKLYSPEIYRFQPNE